MVSLAKLIAPKIFSPSSRHVYHPVDSPPTSPSRPQPSRPPFLHHPHRHPRKTANGLPLAFALITLFTTALFLYHFVFRLTFVDHFIYGAPDLPNYDEWIAYEDNLPQHNTSLPPPEGPDGRYVMFSNQQWGYGFNNNLQEVLMLSQVAYLSGRAYVFQPYTWNARTASNATLDGRHWRSATIPLSAFLAGPTAGGPFARDDPAPRSVNVKWWNNVCPPSRRTIVDVKEENTKWGVNENTQGRTILKHYADLLREMKDPCIEVVGPVIFDFALFASPRLLSIWPSLSISPILTRFQWSPLILNAVSSNLPLFSDAISISSESPSPSSSVLHSTLSTSALSVPISTSHPHAYDDRRGLEDLPPPVPQDAAPIVERRGRDRPKPVGSTFSSQGSNDPSSSYNVTTSPPIPGLVALHLRRGDFRVHCHWLADRSEPFAGWNQFTFLLDRFTPPESFGVLGRGRHHETYMKRCWPTTQAIVKMLNEMKQQHPHLDRVFLLTNGDKAWLNELKHALGLAVEGYVSVEDGKDGKNETVTTHTDLYWEPGEAPPEGLTARGSRAAGSHRSLETSPDPRSVATNLGGWKSVITSKDVVLSKNEREVDQAIDMEIARRAEVFIGNGFSSLTSNIVMLRLSDSTPIENIRFW